jgi:hypothetical protein
MGTANTGTSNGNVPVISGGTIPGSIIPTLNQNTTGTASNVTGTVAIANGGTGATTAAGALSNLGVCQGLPKISTYISSTYPLDLGTLGQTYGLYIFTIPAGASPIPLWTLPKASTMPNQTIILQCQDAHYISNGQQDADILPHSGDHINLVDVELFWGSQHCYMLYSDGGTNWYVLFAYGPSEPLS